LLVKSLAVAAGLLIAFLVGVPIALASFLAACLLLVSRRHQPQAVFAEFDWSLHTVITLATTLIGAVCLGLISFGR
jgi:Na+/H+ antiporter NhaD/arsenite permease-like protein